MSGGHLLAFAGISSLGLIIASVILLQGKDPWRVLRPAGKPLNPVLARRFGGLCLAFAIVNLCVFTAVAFGLLGPVPGIDPISFN